jgi:hypothetical protein
MGPDENSEQDLQNNDRHSAASAHFGQQGRSDRRGENHEYRVICRASWIPISPFHAPNISVRGSKG